MKEHYGNFVDGEFRSPVNSKYTWTQNPGTGESLTKVADSTVDDINDAVQAATRAKSKWQNINPAQKGRLLQEISDRIRQQKDELAKFETLDQGKPISDAISNVELGARYFEYYSGIADKLEGKSIPLGEDNFDFTVREPYGVSGQITPWNFPFSIACRGIAPALAAGNTTVLKPAPTTPLTSLKLAEICHSVGIPEGVVNVVTGGAVPGEALTNHDNIDVITFTGSISTGQKVMNAASESITPITLELGGKNAAIVLPDADIEEATSKIATGIFSNAGQVCSAADRALVHESIYNKFIENIVSIAESYELESGMEDPDMGPVNNQEQYQKVKDYIQVGIKEGATLETGGRGLEREGFFISPTVFSNASNEMRIAQEEIFGPVLTVIPFRDTQEAIEMANNVRYGLTGGVFGSDIRDALSVARDLEAGSVGVNEWYGGGIETPFGGMKESGIGREKGLEALDSYLETKNISIGL